MNIFRFAKLLSPFVLALKGGGGFVSALDMARTLSNEGKLSQLRNEELLAPAGGTGIGVDPDAFVKVIPTSNGEHRALEPATNPGVSLVRNVIYLVQFFSFGFNSRKHFT